MKNKERQKAILIMRLDGMTYEQISKKLGISRQRVQGIIAPPLATKQLVYKRASDRCELCGILVGKSGHIHHNGNNGEDYNDVESLQLLCPSCHRKVHDRMLKGCGALPYEQRTVDLSQLQKPNGYLTTHEVADLLHFKVITIQRWCESGKLKAVKIHSRWRIREKDVKVLVCDKRLEEIGVG